MTILDRAIVRALPAVPRPVVKRHSSRYIAGTTLVEACDTVRELNAGGKEATLDVLGEEVTLREEAVGLRDAYRRALDTIVEDGLRSNVSVKLTALGLKLDHDLCRANLVALVEEAARFGNFVRIDMEDHTCTDPTLRIYRELQARHGNLGVVLQAYMRRTLRDISELPREGANVRICKGIYVEPRQIAWKGFDTVRANYLSALEKMIVLGVYPAIATHDEYLACAAAALVDRHGLARDKYEFQMLLGVDEQLRRILIASGHRLRVYVPYGHDWYPYSMRRLRENPEVARHVLKAMLKGR